MQPALGDFGLQQLPDYASNVLTSRNLSGQFSDVVIEMTMIHALHDFAFENLFQFFQVQDHAGHRIRLALDGYFQRVIVPVAVRVIALPEDSTVLLSRKIRVVINMRGGKLDFSREKNHGVRLSRRLGSSDGVLPAFPLDSSFYMAPVGGPEHSYVQRHGGHVIKDEGEREMVTGQIKTVAGLASNQEQNSQEKQKRILQPCDDQKERNPREA